MQVSMIQTLFFLPFLFLNNVFRLILPWKSPYPDLLSMAVAKGSPYLPFLKRFLLHYKEKGAKKLI